MDNQLEDPIEHLLLATQTGGGDLLICRCCNNAITTAGEKITIGLSHHYRFTNPLGVSYNIGCFRNAPGCSIVGEPTSEASWFGGYRWQIAICAECQEHLGWYYQNAKQRFFFGLIPERLLTQQPQDNHQ